MDPQSDVDDDLSGGGSGDPHITTLSGIKYTL